MDSYNWRISGIIQSLYDRGGSVEGFLSLPPCCSGPAMDAILVKGIPNERSLKMDMAQCSAPNSAQPDDRTLVHHSCACSNHCLCLLARGASIRGTLSTGF